MKLVFDVNENYSSQLSSVCNGFLIYYTDRAYFQKKMVKRLVEKVVLSQWQSEGRGARVRRSIGRPELRSSIIREIS